MQLPPFTVNWDYRCPFARNVHEHLATALEAGAPWEVTFQPFWLTQTHVAEGDPPAWDDPAKASELTALAAGVVVRDRFPEHFLRVHRALFAARHDHGRDLRDTEVVRQVLDAAGAPAEQVLAELEAGWPQKEIRAAHEQAVAELEVFGVPTFVVGHDAAFARIMSRPDGDVALATATIERVVRLMVDVPDLNELKHTTIDR